MLRLEMDHDLDEIQYLHSSDHINELCVGSNILGNSKKFIPKTIHCYQNYIST